MSGAKPNWRAATGDTAQGSILILELFNVCRNAAVENELAEG